MGRFRLNRRVQRKGPACSARRELAVDLRPPEHHDEAKHDESDDRDDEQQRDKTAIAIVK